MVDISDFIDPDGGDEDGGDAGGEAEDLAALKACLQALADAIASTNLAVFGAAQGDPAAATARVQASVGALKRFHENFVILKGDAPPAEEEESED